MGKRGGEGRRWARGALGCVLPRFPCRAMVQKWGGLGGFGDVWGIYGVGNAGGCGAASSRCILALSITGRCKHHVILKKPLYGLKTTEKRPKVSKAEGTLEGSED